MKINNLTSKAVMFLTTDTEVHSVFLIFPLWYFVSSVVRKCTISYRAKYNVLVWLGKESDGHNVYGRKIRLDKLFVEIREKDQKIAQSTHENGYIKPRKTFWRNSKQLLKTVSKIKRPSQIKFETVFFMLGYSDSNQEKQDQNLLCYHYTIAQTHNIIISSLETITY